MMFTLGAVAEDEAKLEVLKKVYGQMSTQGLNLGA